MALIDWSDDYSVKVQSIDKQHQKLVELINSLHSAMKQGKGKEAIEIVIRDLISYTKVHFAHEESLMEKYSYPGFLKHKAVHDELVKQVMEIEKNFREGKTIISQDILNFLKRWLVDHILAADKQYSSLLTGKGAA